MPNLSLLTLPELFARVRSFLGPLDPCVGELLMELAKRQHGALVCEDCYDLPGTDERDQSQGCGKLRKACIAAARGEHD